MQIPLFFGFALNTSMTVSLCPLCDESQLLLFSGEASIPNISVLAVVVQFCGW
jgi:hypothetical protein